MEKDNEAVKETEQSAAVVQEPDYKALLEKAEAEKENYKTGLLKAKGKLPQDPLELDEEKMDDLASRVAAKITPDLKSSLISTVAKNDIDSKLEKLTDNKDKQELIRYHFEYSTIGDDIDSRLANAQAIADKDLIAKKATEIQLAKPKVTSSSSMGSSSASGASSAQDDYFTPEQIKDLQKRAAAAGIKFDLNAYKASMERVKRGEGMNLHTIR